LNDLIDFALDDEGDFELDENGDLAISRGADCLVDNLEMVIKTQKGDSIVEPDLGADLEELVGELVTEELAFDGALRIMSEALQKGIVNPGEIEVVPIPLGENILYYVFIEKKDGTRETLEYILSMETGEIINDSL